MATDRVRRNTSPRVARRIDSAAERRVRSAASEPDPALDRRIRSLDREWDVERSLETCAASFVVAGVLLGRYVDRRWLLVPGVVGAFLLQHALQGWCPPLPVCRRLGFRTRREIDEEKYALKALRGDFGAKAVARRSASAALAASRA
jgi:hypothetical protein